MITDVLSVLYFLLPAIVANMVPVHVRGINFFNWRLDFNATLRKKPLFGAHKTWRGLIFGVAAGLCVFFLQQLIFTYGYLHAYALIDYSRVHVLLGAALGLGALIGDALESVVKRQIEIAPGKSLFVFDQIDFVLGAYVVGFVYIIDVWQDALIALIVVFLLNLVVQRSAFLLGLKDDPL